MAKKAKPKKAKGGGGDGSPFESLPYHGLFVKISSKAGDQAAGKMFLIPTSELLRFRFIPKNETAFDQSIDDPRVNVDYAIYTGKFIVFGSAGG
jgi:hypothetical protein